MMEPLKPRFRIVIFLVAVICTVILATLAVKLMHVASAFTASLGQGEIHASLLIGAGSVFAIIIFLRFYLRRRARLVGGKR